MGSELPHKAAVIPGAAELSVARVYIRCAPAHSDISVGTHISVGLHLGKLPGTTPCYSPHKSVGTRSGVVPGAPVGVLASWDVGAPRSDRQAVPEKEGQIFSVEKCWPGCQFQYCHRKGTSAFQHLRFWRDLVCPPTAREMRSKTHHMGARFREDPEWPRAFRATVAADERREKLYGVCHRAGFAQRHRLDGS